MAWEEDELNRIGGSTELRITTTRADGSQRRWTPIWVVRAGDDLYIRSAGGSTPDWYRHAIQHNQALVKAGGIEADVTVQPIEDPAVIDQVTTAYRANQVKPSRRRMRLRRLGELAVHKEDQ